MLVGDPDDRMRGLARAVDRAIEGALERPFDPGLRGALRGEPGEDDDGLLEVRRERRRLGLGEAADAAVLTALGRRAGAVAVAVVRAGADGAELVVFDVRNGAFYEGALRVDEAMTPARVASFVRRRARLATVGRATPAPERVPAPAGAVTADPETEEEDEPDFFEQYWPYMAAAVLLGGMIAIIAVTSTTDGSSSPVLRFVPGGR